MAEWLREAGHTVVEGETAVDVIQSMGPADAHTILFAIEPGAFTELMGLARLRELPQAKNAAVIGLTASTGAQLDQVKQLTAQLSVAEFVAKPLLQAQIYAAVDRQLRRIAAAAPKAEATTTAAKLSIADLRREHPRLGGQDFFTRLEVARDADFSAIKVAFAQLMKRYDIDNLVEQNRESRRMVREIQEGLNKAFVTLRDPKRRAKYAREIERSAIDTSRKSSAPIQDELTPWGDKATVEPPRPKPKTGRKVFQDDENPWSTKPLVERIDPKKKPSRPAARVAKPAPKRTATPRPEATPKPAATPKPPEAPKAAPRPTPTPRPPRRARARAQPAKPTNPNAPPPMFPTSGTPGAPKQPMFGPPSAIKQGDDPNRPAPTPAPPAPARPAPAPPAPVRAPAPPKPAVAPPSTAPVAPPPRAMPAPAPPTPASPPEEPRAPLAMSAGPTAEAEAQDEDEALAALAFAASSVFDLPADLDEEDPAAGSMFGDPAPNLAPAGSMFAPPPGSMFADPTSEPEPEPKRKRAAAELSWFGDEEAEDEPVPAPEPELGIDDLNFGTPVPAPEEAPDLEEAWELPVHEGEERTNADVLIDAARLQSVLKEYRGAAQLLERALRARPNDPIIRYRLELSHGQLYLERGDLDNAREHLSLAAEMEPHGETTAQELLDSIADGEKRSLVGSIMGWRRGKKRD